MSLGGGTVGGHTFPEGNPGSFDNFLHSQKAAANDRVVTFSFVSPDLPTEHCWNR